MTERDGGPAFGSGNPTHGGFTGMSLRDYFAGQALAGICANPNHQPGTVTFMQVGEDAYKFADAMLAAREDTP